MVANTIISEAKNEPSTYLGFAYEIHGCMLMEEDRQEDIPKLVDYLEKSVGIYKVIGIPYERLEQLIAMAKSSNNPEAMLKHHEELYKHAVASEGESSQTALMHGKSFAKALKHLHYGAKAEKLLQKLLNISRRVHGDKHGQTARIRNSENHFMVRFLIHNASAKPFSLDNIGDAEKYYQLVEYEDSFFTLIIRGPYKNSDDEDIQIGNFRASNDSVIFALGTPIICHDEVNFGELGDIVSWDNEREHYTIRWEDESLGMSTVHRSDIRVPRCLCGECRETNPFPIDIELPKTANESALMMAEGKDAMLAARRT